MEKLNADKALAVETRKYGGIGRGGVTASSPTRALAKPLHLFT